MSGSKKKLGSMPAPPADTEKFLAMLLWAQKGDCNCVSCSYFKDMGKTMMDKHITQEGT